MRLAARAALLLLLAPLSSCDRKPAPGNAAPGGAPHYVIGCNILDSSFLTIRSYPGKLCAFLEDGTFLSAQDEPARLSRIGARGEVLWTRPIHVHHQLKISEDGKRILAPSAEIRDGDLCRTRYDDFLILDLASGRELARWSGFEHRKELFRLAGRARIYRTDPEHRSGLDFECEFTHFNSIQEIPENPVAREIPAFAKGNVFAGLNGLGIYAILDPQLKRILWTAKNTLSPLSFHDPQVLGTGEILVYNNKIAGFSGMQETGLFSLQILDPRTMKTRWQYPASEKDRVHVLPSGGAQIVPEGVLFNVNTEKEGGVAKLIDWNGRTLWSFANPAKHPDGRTRVYQEIKRFDLTRFLAANQL